MSLCIADRTNAFCLANSSGDKMFCSSSSCNSRSSCRFFNLNSEIFPSEYVAIATCCYIPVVLLPLSSGVFIAPARVTMASATADPRFLFGVPPVMAGICRGSSKLSWWSAVIICSHRCICGNVYALACLFFSSATVSLTFASNLLLLVGGLLGHDNCRFYLFCLKHLA